MKETIGVRARGNDYKRTLIIKRKRLKKIKQLEKDKKLKELEKKVKYLQIITFIKTIPLVFSLTTIKTIINNTKLYSNSKKEELKGNEENLYEEKTDVKLENEEKEKPKEEEKLSKVLEEIEITEIDSDIKYKEEDKKISTDVVEKDNSFKRNLEKLEEKEILNKYNNDLKEARTNLKEVAGTNSDKTEEAEYLLDKLNAVIKKIDDLIEKIAIENNIDKNYLYSIVEEYTKTFEEGKKVEEFKDSEFYILLAEKVRVINSKALKLKEELQEQEKNKAVVELISEPEEIKDEEKSTENVEKIERKSIPTNENDQNEFDYEDFNKKIHGFQNEENKIVEETRINIEKTKDNVQQKIEKLRALSISSILLISLISTKKIRMPSIRNSKAVATATLIGIYFMNKILKGKRTKKIKKINYEDYTNNIESNLTEMTNALDLIKNANIKIDDLINKVNTEFSDLLYMEEVQKLLERLNRIKQEIIEKEYEVNKIIATKEQEKVKTYA